MAKKQVRIVIGKDGSIRSETHGVKGKECLDLLEKLLGEMMVVANPDLKAAYYEKDDTVQIDDQEQQVGEGNS